MAELCKCCGKKVGFLGSSKLSEEFNEPICDNCYAKFRVKLNIFKNLKDISELTVRKEELIKTLDDCNFLNEGKSYILAYMESVENTINDKEHQLIEEERLRNEAVFRQLQIKENIGSHILTTGYNFENYRITSYLGVISGSVVLGTGFLSEFGAGIGDLLGGQVDTFSDKIEQARDLALDKLKEKSAHMGGNAIIGIDFDYITFSNNMIGVVANGTSVIVEGKDSFI